MASFYTYNDLQNWSAATADLQPPARLAVIGDPIAHSKSPQMHNPALEACGLGAQYVRIQVPAGRVKEAFGLFQQNDFIGINITIPHKFEALDAVDELDPLAARLGAVNTLVIRNGRLHGYNSDGPGFLASVKEAFGTDVKNLRVLILGAGGGAGRAVAVQSVLAGCGKLILANRTESKLGALVAELTALDMKADFQTCTLESEAVAARLDEVDLIVNATSVGMKEGDAPLLPPDVLARRHCVYDMVYRASSPTELIQAAQAAGAMHADGMSLLLHQGAVSFEHWFPGVQAPLEVMRAALAASSKPA